MHRLRIINNSLLKTIFRPKREEVTGDWRKLHDDESHDSHSSPCIIRVIKKRKMTWVGQVAHMGEIKNHVVGKPDEKHYLEGLRVQRRTISKQILEKQGGRV
jgi:hypothetical protein